MKEPFAKKITKEITQHGQKRVDNYSWLRDDNWKNLIKGDLSFADPEVKSYLQSEADYTSFSMQDTKDVQNLIYNELLSRTKEDDISYPFERNGVFYYSKTLKGKSYPYLCRKIGDCSGAKEHVYFDINQEAKDHKLYMHRASIPNESNSYFLYAYNLTGSMQNTIKVREFATGKDLPWVVENVSNSLMWLDDETIAFIEIDEFSRGKKMFSMNIKLGLTSKKLLFEKPEEYTDRFMGASRTTDKKVSFIYLSAGASVVVYKKHIDDSEFSFLKKTTDDISYRYEHHDGHYFILTNDFNNSNFALFSCLSHQLQDSDEWVCLIENSSDLYMTSMSCYAGKLIINTRNTEKAIDDLLIYDIAKKSKKTVSFSSEVKFLNLYGAYDHNSKNLQVTYETPVQPEQVMNLNLDTLQLNVLATKEVPCYEAANYTLTRDFAQGHDGEMIPLTIVHKKDFKLNDQNNKAYVYSYGSYGYGFPPYFSSSIFSLVDRGFAYVIAHIRGGNEKGHSWYLKGKMRNKLNTFKDYISSCEHLIAKGYVSEGNIVANGGSAGGLLMGAVTNMRPDLFNSVIADVPFVDVINTISDASLPLTPPEWEEWGNPIESKDDFEYMMQYSPYDNVIAQNYPHMLFNSGISDEQVTYWEPAKMVAKLRELKTDNNTLLLNIKMHAGHAGETDRYEGLRDRAFNFAFALKGFGI